MSEDKRLPASMEESVVTLLLKKHLKIATAESCTGGLVVGTLINVPGCSEVIHESFITYSNEAKIKYVHVNKETLEQFGAVSEETAREMACGVAKTASADIGVSTTGIAGPDGGTSDKPVGTVYIGCCIKDKCFVKKCRFHGNRMEVRSQTVENALKFVEECILQELN